MRNMLRRISLTVRLTYGYTGAPYGYEPTLIEKYWTLRVKPLEAYRAAKEIWS